MEIEFEEIMYKERPINYFYKWKLIIRSSFKEN